jgi:Trypsin
VVYALLAWLIPLLPIIGGTDDDAGDPAVVSITIGGGQCSGVVVAPRVVVTAAHCIAPGTGTVDVGGVTANVVTTWVDRYYTGDVDHDLAALRLDRDATVAPIPIASPVLGSVRLIGFGATAPDGPRGTRHVVATQIIEVDPRQARAGGEGATTCTGDSGGAALDDTGALVGVITAGDDSCSVASYLVRPDAEPDLTEVIAAWSGACPADGTCVTGCNDPDCDPCAFEGTCGVACPNVDLDCPLGGLAGDTCAVAEDCESRVCAGDELGHFCSAPCTTATDCPAPLGACVASTCAYTTQTPGIAGAACDVDRECRSQLCDLDAGSCTIPCGTNDACPATFSCEPVRDTRACTHAGGCAATGGDRGLMIFVIAALAFARSKRQTAAACLCSTVSK